MLELQDLSLQLPDAEEDQFILHDVQLRLPVRGHFVAVVGPSGCGKSTLLKLIAGLREPSGGRILWEGRDLASEGDLAPHEIGYVPQFSIAYDALTVRESVETASRLRLAAAAPEERRQRLAEILEEVGLDEIADRRVQVLSGGQRRRLALALEMVASPRLLLCDEVTSGLDPKAEDEIVHLLQSLSRKPERLVISVTHSLRHLSLCDSVLVLFGGRVAYHGLPGAHVPLLRRGESRGPLLHPRASQQRRLAHLLAQASAHLLRPSRPRSPHRQTARAAALEGERRRRPGASRRRGRNAARRRDRAHARPAHAMVDPHPPPLAALPARPRPMRPAPRAALWVSRSSSSSSRWMACRR